MKNTLIYLLWGSNIQDKSILVNCETLMKNRMQTYELKGRRYYELFSIAKSTLEQYQAIDSLTANFENTKEFRDGVECHLAHIKLKKSDLLIIAVDYSVSSLEAYINYVGYILFLDWENYEKSNFYQQYKKVFSFLKEINQGVSEITKDEPYPGFTKHRKIRNNIHHVHSSIQDHKKNDVTYSDSQDFSMHFDMLNSWPNISSEIANDAVNRTKEFYENTHTLLKNKQGIVKDHYKRQQLSVTGEISNKRKFLKDYITHDTPFIPSMVVSSIP